MTLGLATARTRRSDDDGVASHILCYKAPPSADARRPESAMRDGIHPSYEDIHVTCACGNEFVTRSTAGHDLRVDICSKCHPFFTGTQKIVDSAGRVDRFNRKYGNLDLAKLARRR